MCKRTKCFMLLLTAALLLCGCSGQADAIPTVTLVSSIVTAAPEQALPPTGTPAPTASPLPATSTPEPTGTAGPTGTPTPIPLPTLSGSGGGVIAFAREDSKQRDIYLMNADGSQAHKLTDDPNWDNWPSWSPDGSRLVYTCRQKVAGLGGGICVINADGTGRKQLSNGNDWEPSWSPDGEHIVFASQRDGNPEIYLMNSDGTQPRRLTHDPQDDWQAAWSPDSSTLAITSGRDGDWEIYLMDVSDGGLKGDSELVRLTDNEVMDGFAAWSPDGSRIVFSSMRDGNEEIYLMDSDGSNPVRLTNNENRESFPRWSPDGEWIAFEALTSYQRVFSFDLFKMKADGTLQIRLTKDNMVDEMCPNWRPEE